MGVVEAVPFLFMYHLKVFVVDSVTRDIVVVAKDDNVILLLLVVLTLDYIFVFFDEFIVLCLVIILFEVLKWASFSFVLFN